MKNLRVGNNSKLIIAILSVIVMTCVLLACIAFVGDSSAFAFAEGETMYNIVFANGDGSVLYQTQVAEGEIPVCQGTPVRAGDNCYDYTFSHWTNGTESGIKPATEDADYYPMFTTSYSTWEFSLTSNFNNVTYGTAVVLEADYGCPISNAITYEYTWSKDGKAINTPSSSKLTLVNVSESGLYTLDVTLTRPRSEPESYTSNAVLVTIAPLSVAVQWAGTTATYTGSVSVPQASATAVKLTVNEEGEAVSNPDYQIDLSFNGGVDVAPRQYVAKAETKDANYTLTNVELEYTIEPMEVEVSWGARELPYNGADQHRSASAIGAKNEEISLEYTGVGADIGEIYYTSVTTNNENYKLTNTEADFIIIKRTVDVIWQLETAYTYNGENQIDDLIAVFKDGLGRVKRMDITIITSNKDDEKSFVNVGNYTIYATLPEEYQGLYTISSSCELIQTARMVKAEPKLTITNTSPRFVFDGEAKSIDAHLSSGEEIIYIMDGEVVQNSFVQPGNYTVLVKSEASENYMPAAGVAVNLIIEVTDVTSSGDVSATIQNSNGISPTAVFTAKDVTEAQGNSYQPRWSEVLVQVVDISLNDNGITMSPEGTSVVKVAVPEALSGKEEVYIYYTVDRYSGKYETVPVEDGYITLNLKYLGHVAFYDSSMNEGNIVTNKGVSSSVLGVVWWSIIAGGCLILVICVAIYFARRCKRIG